MIVLSNCLTRQSDEGCMNVANNLVRRIKALAPGTTVVTYQRRSPLSDVHLELNKLLLSKDLMGLLRKKREPVLYAPSLTRLLPAAVRIFILSLFAKWGLQVILAMQSEPGFLVRLLLKLSRAELVVLSQSAFEQYRALVGKRVRYLKVGVDLDRFCPVCPEEKLRLREAYHLPKDKPIVLHVGHLKAGRNISCLADLDDRYHVVLVASTLTIPSRDAELRALLESRENVTIFDAYCPDIQQLYQLSDVYLFPVSRSGMCIDSPLSALEAAACGLPVVTTPFGELAQLILCEGFYEITSFEKDRLQELLDLALKEQKDTRKSVMKYDWNKAACQLLENRRAHK
ncbi:MAG: glycosyltransferase family 4 protein [Oscillospiraceae bacterium]|nr:glycosyltransferase family 4 protein [Oscillospiraceae bacterium]